MEKNIGKYIQDMNKLTPELKSRSNVMSTEELSSFFTGLSSFFTNKLPDLVKAFTNNGQVNRTLTDDYNQFMKELIAMEPEVISVSTKVKYSDVSSMKIPVMIGMRSDLLTTCKLLAAANDNINKNLTTILDTTDKYVSSFLSSKDFKLSTDPFFKEAKTFQEAMNIADILDKLVDPNGTSDQFKVSQLVSNCSSIKTVYDELLRISKGNTVDKLNKINKEIATIADKVNTLYEQLSNNKDMEVSKEVIYKLSMVLEDTARYVTYTVSTYHIINQTITTTKHLVEAVSKMVK